MKHRGTIILFIFCFLFGLNGYGSPVLQTDTLKEVQIRGKKTPPGEKSLNPVQSLEGKGLERTNSITVADAVRHFAGVQLKDYGGIGGLKTINVRSLGSLHTAVFYDGLQLGNAQNGQVDLGKFTLDNIESVTLYNGQAPTSLLPARAYALSSSLYLQSKKPAFNQYRDLAKVGVKTGSFGLFNPSITWHHRFNSKIYSSFSSEYQKAHGEYNFTYRNGARDTLLTRNNGHIEALRIEARLAGETRDSSRWWLQAYAYSSNRGLAGAIVRNKFNSSQKLWDDDVFFQGSYQKPVSKAYSFSLRAKYTYNYSRYLDPEWLNSIGKLENTYKQNEAYLSLANNYVVSPALNLSFAADLSRNWMDAEIDAAIDEFPEPVRYTGLFAIASSVKLGKVSFDASVLSTNIQESVKYGKSAANKSVLSPAFSVAWNPFLSSDFKLRGFYKDNFRLPTFNDQYYTLIGNADLKPERARQYNLGMTLLKTLPYKIHNISFHSDIFYNKVKDKIVALPAKSLFLWTMMNIGEVEVRGWESGLNAEMYVNELSTLTAALNYTYQHALDVTPGGANYNEIIPYAPEHAATATLGISLKNINFNYNYIFTGGRYSLRQNTSDSYMDSWDTQDVSVAYKRTHNRIRYKALIEVNNLFDQGYEVVRNYPMPGRSLRLTLNMNY